MNRLLPPSQVLKRSVSAVRQSTLLRSSPHHYYRRQHYSSSPTSSTSSPKPPPSPPSPLPAILLSALTASILTYLALNPPSIFLDVFSPVPEPPIVDARFGSVKEQEHAIRELVRMLGGEEGGRVSLDEGDLLGHGFSPNTYHAPRVPSVVVYAESTEDVQTVMKIASKYRVPVTPWSGGTSLEGHLTAPYGGISLDLSRMNKILAIRPEDGDLTCQSGAGWEEINAHLADEGIPAFFPLDPGPGATIGGMMATGCSGTNAVRYGTAKAEWFLSATVVLPSGQIIKTRSRARKSSAGFDVTKLFIGAEGTLGIVTEATIRLAPLLPTSVAVCAFPDVESATKAAHEILNTGVPIQCIELMDTEMMRAVNQAKLTDNVFTDKDALFLKFQGSPGMIGEASSIVKSIIPKHGGTDLRFAKSDEEAKEIWRARKVAHWSILALNPGAKSWSTDVCVPISKLPALVRETKEDLHSLGLTAAVLGHVGDGNFHTGILFENMDEYEKASGAVHRMVDRAIAMDGTCTGEHGVGVGKKEFLVAELGAGTVQLMKAIKNTIDPLGICNPGKLYPESDDRDSPDEDVVPSWTPATQ